MTPSTRGEIERGETSLLTEFVQEILGRLKRGEASDPESLLEQLREELSQQAESPAEHELVRRCALVHFFDARMLDEVLRPGVEGGGRDSVPFERIAGHENVEWVPTPGEVRFYRVRADVRQSHLNAWLDEHEAAESSATGSMFMQLSRQLAAHCEQRRAELPSTPYAGADDGAVPWTTELTYHLAACDPPQAHRTFVAAFDDADARFDLPRCHDLVEVLRERQALLTAELDALLKERIAYLAARAEWADDYFRTARYLERDTLSRALDALLGAPTARGRRDRSAGRPASGDARWILQLHARGGMGKTIFLRWLVARRCVPDRIPCARIDFDDPRAPHEPWQILYRLAVQLNRQLPNQPFEEVIKYARDIERVRAEPTESVAAVPPPEQLDADLAERFGDALADWSAGQSGQVVLILDTLEEVHLRQRTGPLLSLLRSLRQIHDRRYPGLRLILSGRYALHDRITEFRDEFARAYIDAPVREFSRAEARRYLTENRGLTADRPLSAVVEKAGGLPFTLALYADVLQADPGITADEIRAYPDADYAYLVYRILKRIDDGRVRWLLRYGVVPRTLTLSFIHEVMAEYLPPAMAGDTKYDDPESDEDIPEEERRRLFPRATLTPAELAELWGRLKEYAAPQSWVEPVGHAGAETDALSFQVEVRRPMRDMLQRKQVFGLLHRDAAEYYRRRAGSDPQRWGDWMVEVVYHEFQRQGSAAAGVWRAALEEARARGEPRWRLAIASELTRPGSEYLDEAGAPLRRRDGTLMVEPRILAEAHYEAARASLDVARATPDEPDEAAWEEALRQINLAEQTASRQAMASVFSKVQMALVRAAVAAHARDYDAALSVLDAVAGHAMSPLEAFEFEAQYAECLGRRARHAEAMGHLQVAMEGAAGALPPGDVRTERVHQTFIDEARRSDRLDLALQQLRTLDRFFPVQGDEERGAARRHQRATLLLRAGRAADVVSLAGLPDSGAVQDIPLQLDRAEALLALHSPLKALALCDQFLERLEGAGSRAAGQPSTELWTQAQAARLYWLRGHVFGSLFDFTRAMEDLGRSRSLWASLQRVEKAARCQHACARMQLRELGDLRATRSFLSESDHLKLPAESEVLIESQLLLAELAVRAGEADQAQEMLSEVVRSVVARRVEPQHGELPPRTRVEAAVTILAVDDRAAAVDDALVLRLLLDGLEGIAPEGARLLAAGSLARWTPAEPLPEPLHKPLRELFPILSADLTEMSRAPRADLPLLLLNAVEVQRLLGDGTAAAATLETAWSALRTSSPSPLLQVRRAAERLRHEVGSADDIEGFVQSFGAAPNLCGALLLEEAERLVRTHQRAEAKARLDQAGQYFEPHLFSRSRWAPRAIELRARLSELEGRPEEAMQDRQNAARMYRSLGDATAALRVLAGLQREAAHLETSTAGERSGVVELSVRVATASVGELEVEVGIGSQVARRRTGTPLARELAEAVAKKEPYPRSLVGLGTEWEGIGLDLADLLVSGEVVASLPALLGSAPGGPLDLRLEIKPMGALNAVPWELMRVNAAAGARNALVAGLPQFRHLYRSSDRGLSLTEQTRTLQIALNTLGASLPVDGAPGPVTQRELARVLQSPGVDLEGDADELIWPRLHAALERAAPRPHRVLVLRPSELHQRRRLRGDSNVRGITRLERAYEKAGFVVEVVEEIEEFLVWGLRRPGAPSVIHIAAGFQESPSLGGVALDFSGGFEERAQAVDALSPSMLARALHALPTDAHKPFVVLDPPRPPGLTEATRQLLMRNSFAADLFATGGAPVVIAAGLWLPDEILAVSPFLAETLYAGVPVGEICRALRGLRSRDTSGEDLPPLPAFPDPLEPEFESAVAARSVALFAHNPASQRLLPGGREYR